MMLNKMRSRFVAACMATLMTMVCVVPSVLAAVTGVIQKFYVDSSGTCEISGYFENSDQTDATLILADSEDTESVFNSSNIMDHLMYIDQKPLGNNGVFLFKFLIDSKFSKSPYSLKIGGGSLILTKTDILREIPSKINNISNNAIIVGNDAYNMDSMYYLADNILASIERGGNRVYYKIGDSWFNMLDENATSVDYFTKANAVPESEVDTWDIDYYYSR